MVSRITINVTPTDRRRKISGIQAVFNKLPKDLVIAMEKYLHRRVKEDMLKKMEKWDAVFSQRGIKTGFVVEKKSREVKLKNVRLYAEALITGVNQHGPVYIGDWAERGRIKSLRRPDGSYSKFVEVGGKKSRIKLNNSKRDFWTAVINKHFGENGLVNDYLKENIATQLKKRLMRYK